MDIISMKVEDCRNWNSIFQKIPKGTLNPVLNTMYLMSLTEPSHVIRAMYTTQNISPLPGLLTYAYNVHI